MKAIWTLIFIAIIATTAGLSLLFTDEAARTNGFWLCTGAVCAAEFFLWMGFTFSGTRTGEQAGSFSKLGLVASSMLYFFAVSILGIVAIFNAIPFKVLLALHIVALLGFVIVGGLSAIGTRALQGTDKAARPR